MSLSDMINPIVYQIGKPVMDALSVPPSAQERASKDASVAVSSVILGRGANYVIDKLTDGWFNNVLKLTAGILTSLAGIGAYAAGKEDVGREAIFTSVILIDAWAEDMIKKHVKITSSIQSTMEAVRKGDIGRIGAEMVNKETLMQISKIVGSKSTPPAEVVSVVEEETTPTEAEAVSEETPPAPVVVAKRKVTGIH